MATTTTNYGWTVPTSSDLVKNGATAISTLGQSVDTFLFRPFSKNALVNGGYDVWQRSTSATFAGTVAWVAADRWFGVALGSSPTCTMSRQTADTSNLTYGMRFGRNSGQTATGDVYVGNTLESIDAKRFAGQTVTLSFYVKAGANAPLTFTSQIRTGTGTDQTSATLFSTGWTGGANNSQSNTVTTTMTRYTHTVTLGSTVNQIMIAFTYASTGTAGANEWFQVEGVQLEVGSTATPFSRNASSIQGELAACQRYYVRYGGTAAYEKVAGIGTAYATTGLYFVNQFPVTMRVAPTSIEYSTMQVSDIVNTALPVTSLTLSNAGKLGTGLLAGVASGAVQYRPYDLTTANSTNGYVGFSAEL